jgi:hypothetical protein
MALFAVLQFRLQVKFFSRGVESAQICGGCVQEQFRLWQIHGHRSGGTITVISIMPVEEERDRRKLVQGCDGEERDTVTGSGCQLNNCHGVTRNSLTEQVNQAKVFGPSEVLLYLCLEGWRPIDFYACRHDCSQAT